MHSLAQMEGMKPFWSSKRATTYKEDRRKRT